MKRLASAFSITVVLWLSYLTPAFATTAATDGNYLLSEVTPFVWDGTDANPLQATSADYDYSIGDEATLVYSLPFVFPLYGQNYNKILVDGNGNLRFSSTNTFSSTTAVNSFPLPNAGKGVVIVPWNNDLSTSFYGGVFVQHRIDGQNRVVVEWQAETYTEEGFNLLNNFEAIIYPDGTIRFNYKSFTAQIDDDTGSGISRDDNISNINLSSTFAPVYALLNQAPDTGRSFLFELSKRTLTVNFLGNGNSTITSSPTGIACNTTCSADFPLWTNITLSPAISQYDAFGGWSVGACTGSGNCAVTLNANAAVTTTFNRDTAHEARIGDGTPVYYTTIQDAYDHAINGDVIKIWDTVYNEGLICGKATDVKIQGGYDKNYQNIIGMTQLTSPLIIKQGTLRVNNMSVMPHAQ